MEAEASPLKATVLCEAKGSLGHARAAHNQGACAPGQLKSLIKLIQQNLHHMTTEGTLELGFPLITSVFKIQLSASHNLILYYKNLLPSSSPFQSPKAYAL